MERLKEREREKYMIYIHTKLYTLFKYYKKN
jgi:hypothetical protein